MENRYHKVVGLDPVLNWLLKSIKTQEYHVNLHLLVFLISMVPYLGVSEKLSLLWVSQKLRAKCGTCVVVDKTRTTYGHMDLRTYCQYKTAKQNTDQLFTDLLTNHRPIIHGLDNA